MRKRVMAYKVTKLEDVDVTWYVEGDIFIDNEGGGVLVNGGIKPISNEVDLSDYIKKSTVKQNYAKKSDLDNLTTETRVQEMIDEAIGDGGA